MSLRQTGRKTTILDDEILKVKKIDKYNRRYNYYNQKAKEFKIFYLMYHHIINKRKLNFIGKINLLALEVEKKIKTVMKILVTFLKVKT